MAFIASAYALFTVFNNPFTAIGFGIIWGLLIFNLDRFIVSTIKKQDRLINELIQALPRIVLALIIAIVISKPLELKIFEKEINQILLEQKNELTLANQDQIALQFNPKTSALEQDILQFKNEIATKETQVNLLYDIYINEAEGKTGTNLLGKGPVYKEKRDKHDAALVELKQLKEINVKKIASTETAIAKLKTDYQKQVATTQPIIDGLMARLQALNTLPWLPSFFIFLLFLAIETSPIIAKLLSPKGEYNFKLEHEEHIIKTWTTQQVNQEKMILKTDTILNDKVYKNLAQEQELYAFKKKIAKELLEKQQSAFYNKKTKIL